LDGVICKAAAESGNLEMLQWCPWDEETCYAS